VQASASSDLVLIARPPALEYPRTDLPPQFWFVGPLTWEPFTPMPGRVADLAPEPPIVYVSQGATYNRNPVILKLAVRALVDEPVQMVVTTVRPFVASEFEPFPENAVIERFVPFSRLLDRISLVVSHGGAGAVHAALSRGIPVIILPFTADQFEVAARCEWRGVGIRLDPWKCTPEQLRSAVRTILSDASYRDRAHRIRESCAAIDGPQLACELLERLAATRSPVHRPTTAFNPWAEEVSYEHTVRAN
jgi:MGT family glycosyltransferase